LEMSSAFGPVLGVKKTIWSVFLGVDLLMLKSKW
jgi:hypothetical protein